MGLFQLKGKEFYGNFKFIITVKMITGEQSGANDRLPNDRLTFLLFYHKPITWGKYTWRAIFYSQY